MRLKPFLFKLTHWEHWPSFMFYFPLLPYFLYKIIRVGNPIFFLVTNPSILYSGCGTESKHHTLSMIPDQYLPENILIKKGTKFKEVLIQLNHTNITYPLIAKPDQGFRGYLVKKINSELELKNYFSRIKLDIIIQKFIDYEYEMGIFYHRIPGQAKGKITSLTLKKYLTLKGDGVHTLSELIFADKRAFLYYDLFKKIHQEKIDQIVQKDKKITLSFIGNHSKGAQFINGNHLINSDLEKLCNSLNRQIKGWYYGRLDLKYKSFEALCKGKEFQIIEINGLISEPTHIYDPLQGATYFDALKSIKYHWKIISEIALKNHEKGMEYPKLSPFIQNLKELNRHSKLLKKLS